MEVLQEDRVMVTVFSVAPRAGLLVAAAKAAMGEGKEEVACSRLSAWAAVVVAAGLED